LAASDGVVRAVGKTAWGDSSDSILNRCNRTSQTHFSGREPDFRQSATATFVVRSRKRKDPLSRSHRLIRFRRYAMRAQTCLAAITSQRNPANAKALRWRKW